MNKPLNILILESSYISTPLSTPYFTTFSPFSVLYIVILYELSPSNLLNEFIKSSI